MSQYLNFAYDLQYFIAICDYFKAFTSENERTRNQFTNNIQPIITF
jgi:hypothetical protein